MQANSYITDRSLDIIARTRGYTTNEVVYTFGAGGSSSASAENNYHKESYLALVQSGASSYGTSVSSNARNWAPIANISSNAPSRVIWDGTKWIVSRSDATDLLYSYNADSFTAVDTSGATIACVECNTKIYVGIGKGGLFFGYDGINWTNSTSGTALFANTDPSSAQIGKVAWNGSLWVAVSNGASYTIAYSQNGVNWTGVANSTAIFDISGGAVDVAWNGSVWVATGANSAGNLVAVSSDGINWTNVNASNVGFLTL
ncbi:hypothetical protein EB093_08645 [bacterium]|nr:hypothetical protein [bacterium]